MEGSGMMNIYSRLPARYRRSARTYRNYEKVRIKLPFRGALVGSSGSGKSNVVINLIFSINAFDKILFFCKSPEEPLYQFFFDAVRAIEEKLGVEILTVSTDLDELPDIDSFDPKLSTLLVFDDIITSASAKLQNVADVWIRGRKNGVSSLFLSQSFFHIPKLIRSNTDLFFFKRLGKKDLTLVMSDFSLNKTSAELLAMYNSCNTNDITNFFLIDLSPGQDQRLVFRHNFNPIDPEGDHI